MGRYVELKLTPLEAQALAAGTDQQAEDLRTNDQTHTTWDRRKSAAFWRALAKLEAARRAAEEV